MAYFIARYRGSETGEVAFECDPPEVDEDDDDQTLIIAAEAAIPEHVSLDDVEIQAWPCGGCRRRECMLRATSVHACASSGRTN